MAGPLEQALPWIDAVKRGMLSQVATAASAPETIGPNIWSALKDMAQNLGLAKTPEQLQRDEDLKGIMYARSPEGEAAQREKVAEVMMGFGEGGIAGALRPRGNPSLMLSHGLSTLEAAHGETIKELMHPSLAITGEGKLNNPFGSGGWNSYLIPRVGAFDPAYSSSTLFNRDAYTARRSDFPGGTYPRPAERILTRGLQVPPHSEGTGTTWARDPNWEIRNVLGSQQTAIEASPIFRSLAEFENSSKGAKTLGHNPDDISAWAQHWDDAFKSWWAIDASRRGSLPQNWLKELRLAARDGDKRALDLLRSAQTAPSEYAELKVSGPVSLTGDRFAGAILAPGHTQHGQVLEARGIPSIKKLPHQSSEELFRIADAMQRLAGPVKERSMRVRAGWEPGQDAPPREIKIEGNPSVDPLFKGVIGVDPAAAFPEPSGTPSLKMTDFTQNLTGHTITPWANPGAKLLPAVEEAASKALNAFLNGASENTIFSIMGKKYHVDPQTGFMSPYE